jgi:hypothetical protein
VGFSSLGIETISNASLRHTLVCRSSLSIDRGKPLPNRTLQADGPPSYARGCPQLNAQAPRPATAWAALSGDAGAAPLLSSEAKTCSAASLRHVVPEEAADDVAVGRVVAPVVVEIVGQVAACSDLAAFMDPNDRVQVEILFHA